jgi:hypothetical protein
MVFVCNLGFLLQAVESIADCSFCSPMEIDSDLTPPIS